MKRISAARCGSVPSSRARLSTRVREAPGVPSAPKASLWKSRTRSVRAARGVEINDVAARIDGKEAARSMIEVVDRVLHLLKDVLLPLALAGHVAERPYGETARALGFPV